MAYQLNEGQGSLFVNDKQGNPNRPDLKGTILINGQTYYVSGWYKTSSNGTQYLSLSAQLPRQNPQPQYGQPQYAQPSQQMQPPYGGQQTPQYAQPRQAPQMPPQAPQYPSQQYPSQPMMQTGVFPQSPVGTVPGAPETDDLPAF